MVNDLDNLEAVGSITGDLFTLVSYINRLKNH